MNSEHAAAIGRGRGRVLRLVRPTTGSQRVWLFSGLLAVMAAGLFFPFAEDLETLHMALPVPWWALALMFALAEVLVVHVQFRRNAFSFSMSEIPVVIALFSATPSEFILALLVGSTLALAIHRRQSLLKLAFNLSHFMLEGSLALIVFHLFGPETPLEPMAWAGTFVAMFVAGLVADVAVEIAVSLSEGNESRVQYRALGQRVMFGKIVSATNTSIALISAMILWSEPQAAWLLAVPAAILFFSYRIYTSQRDQHERMEFLYESTHMLNRQLQVDAAVRALLSQAQKMFRAEFAEILLFPEGDGDSATRTVLGPEGEERATEPVELDPTEGVWARVTAEAQPILLARPIANQQLQRYFAAQGIRDAMVAPLRGGNRVTGTMLVGNRMGDVSTFDAADLRLFEALANHASTSLENARLVQRLEESLDELRLSNRMKDDFVATVSHELRTPLTAIQGSVKTLLQSEVTYDAETQRTLLEAVDRQGERLRRLIEDLLVAARIESRALHPVVAPVSLTQLARQVVEGLGSRTDSHVIRVDALREPISVQTDERRVEQIVANLLDNALKYSPHGSTVTIRIRDGIDGAEISVEDQGPGVPFELRDKVFERFYQADQTSTRAVGGTGLGLWICRRLAEVIGGRMSVGSAQGPGSVFTLWVPAEPPADAIPASESTGETIDLIAAQRG